MDIDPEKIIHSPFFTGAIGALVTAVKFTPGASWLERAANIGFGALVSGFVTPALIEWLNVKSQAYLSCAAFMLGLLGMSLAAAALDGIKTTKFGEIVDSWLRRKG
jgi:hypothetical protein